MKAWFKLEIQGVGGRLYDVTDNVAVSGHDGIRLEEHADLLDKLTFVLRSTDTVSALRFIDSLTEAMKVRLWFGYGEGQQRYNGDDEMFFGYIGRLQTRYLKSGYPELEVTAFDPAWMLTKYQPVSQKTWPGKKGEKWTYEQLVENVMTDYAGTIDIGKIEIPPEYSNIVFDEKHPAVQKADENDWKFLKRLAFDDYEEVSLYDKQGAVNLGCECMVYVELKNGKPQLFFVPESSKTNEMSNITFYYPMHGTKIPLEQDVTSSKATMIVEDITVDEDPETGSEVLVQVPADAFREVLTEEQIKVVNAGGGFSVDLNTYISSFKVDSGLIAADEDAGLIKWGVSEYTAGEVTWEEVKKYVRLKVVYQPAGSQTMKSEISGLTAEELKDPIKKEDVLRAALGKRKKKRKTIGTTMKIELAAGNYNIRPRKTYPVVNIGGKYSADARARVKWFCESVVHSVGDTYKQTLRLTM